MPNAIIEFRYFGPVLGCSGAKKTEQKLTNRNPRKPMKNPRDFQLFSREFHGSSMGSAWVGNSQCNYLVFEIRFPGVFL